MSKKPLHFQTSAIQLTASHDEDNGSIANAIYPSTTFKRELDGSYANGYIYTRDNNPNRRLLENALAQLEGVEKAYAFASGMAAANAVLQSLSTGSHVILPDDAYYTMHLCLQEIYQRWGISYSLVDMTCLKSIQQAIQPNTQLIWVESPSNPLLKVSDIKLIADLAHANNALCVVDNTWATPVLQKPLLLGADISMYSTTKYFGGHSDSLSGALVVSDGAPKNIAETIRSVQKMGGAVPSPFDCWLVLRGIKTLYLRLQKQTSNAFQLAHFLSQQPAIKQVHYPGLDTHPQHIIAQQQMPHGYGAMLSVEIGENQKQAMQMIGQLKLFTAATSLGGVESLIEHRKSVEGDQSQTPDNLLRISVGIEHIDDLIEDWDSALKESLPSQ